MPTLQRLFTRRLAALDRGNDEKYTLQYFKRFTIETPKFILNSLLYSFILALQEASATLLLVVRGHEMMTVGISFQKRGGAERRLDR
jgi:hypothetical protein